MSKADTLALVQTLSNGMADPTTSERLYNDVMFELAREDWTVDAAIIPLTKGQLQVPLAASVSQPLVNINGLIYDNTELEEIHPRLMESIDPYWRQSVRYTRSYVTQDVSRKTVELHPAPFVASNPNLGNFGEPFGLDYPTYNLALFYSYAALAPNDPWYYLELVIALRVLSLEFARESDHMDADFAAMAKNLSDLCKQLLI